MRLVGCGWSRCSSVVKTRVLLAALLLASTGALAACDGDDDKTGPVEVPTMVPSAVVPSSVVSMSAAPSVSPSVSVPASVSPSGSPSAAGLNSDPLRPDPKN